MLPSDLAIGVEDMSVFGELLPLARKHAEEISYDITGDSPLDVDEQTYQKLFDVGALKIFSLRSARALVGYVVYVVSANLERRYLLQAHEVGFFVLPDFRGSRAALRLMKVAERALTDLGCAHVFYHSPMANQKFGSFLSRLGYVKVDEVYARRLLCPVAQ